MMAVHSLSFDPRTVKDQTKRKPLAQTMIELVEGQTAEVVFKSP